MGLVLWIYSIIQNAVRETLPGTEVTEHLCRTGRTLFSACSKETLSAVTLDQSEMPLENHDKKLMTYLYLVLEPVKSLILVCFLINVIDTA